MSLTLNINTAKRLVQVAAVSYGSYALLGGTALVGFSHYLLSNAKGAIEFRQELEDGGRKPDYIAKHLKDIGMNAAVKGAVLAASPFLLEGIVNTGLNSIISINVDRIFI